MRDGWEIKKLGDVATYVNGFAFKPDHWGDVGLPIVRIQNLNNEDAEFNYCDSEIPIKYIIDDGDILISWSASLGVYEWKRGKAYLNQHIFKVVFDKFAINKYYLKYVVGAKLKDMLKDAHGATMKHIVKGDFDNTLISVPPISEQEHIVAELDLLSGIIEKQKQQLKEYDTLAQSIFYDMFGDPITNEKGWEVKKWEDILTIINGKNQRAVENPEGEYPIYGSGGIMGYADECLCPKDTVIIGRKGNINKPIYVREPFWNVDTAFGLVADNISLAADYLYFFCVIYDFEQLNKAVTIPSLTKVDLLKINTPVPPLTLQQEFAKKIEAIEKQKELVKQSLAEAETLFNSRMDYYFN